MKQIADAILKEIQLRYHTQNSFLIAIDGRCAAGKTTLAEYLQKNIDSNVFHMDHFFLRPEQRTKERLQQPGGNVDYERFYEEVLLPLKQGIPIAYRSYDCQQQKLAAPISIDPKPISIIEGSYSCHPKLWDAYDLRIFLTVPFEEQLRRIESRNGLDRLSVFREKWIPMEEQYFTAFQIQTCCELLFQTAEGL